ncbi:ran GTPase-activating protein 1-like isoform X1 [Argonauta hians]
MSVTSDPNVSSLTSLLSQTTVEDDENELSFAGRSLKLNEAEDAKDIIEMIDNFKNMRALRMSGNTVGLNAALAIAVSLEKHPEFQRALWSDMFTGRLREEVPPTLKALGAGVMTAGAHLVELDLSHNAFGAIGVEGIEELLLSPSCYSLKELHLNNNGLGISGGKLLAKTLLKCHENSVAAGAPFQLSVFVSGRNRLENEGAEALAKAFKTIGTLERIEMPQNGIRHKGILALAKAFASNPSIKILNLNDNIFSENGSQAMAEALPNLQELEVINFGDCLLKTGGAKAIGESLRDSHSSLKQLILSGNEIGRDGAITVIKAMKNKEHLENIELNENAVGEDGIEEIRVYMESIGKLDSLGTFSDDEGDDEEEEEEEVEEEEYIEEEEEEEEELEDDDYVEEDELGDNLISNKSVKTPLKATAKEFLAFPSPNKLLQLGNTETIVNLIKDELGDSSTNVDDVVKTFLKIASVVDFQNEKLKKAANKCTDTLFSELLKENPEENASLLLNSLLVHMGLLKGEDHKCRSPGNLNGSLIVLEHCVQQSYFPSLGRDILSAFISRPSTMLENCSEMQHKFLQTIHKF